jgi:hypothetical protein
MAQWKKLLFIRERGTQQFIDQQGTKVGSFAEAATFESTWEACDFCYKNGIKGAEIVMRFGEPVREATVDFERYKPV